MRGRARGVTEGARGVVGSEGWWMSDWNRVVIFARVAGEHGGEEESVERECDDEDAGLNPVACTINCIVSTRTR